jgi:glycosyltransferase involved in cell wall biosynthesis
MLVSLIITTFNQPEALSAVLKSVNAQTKVPDEIIIADDGSDETTKQSIEDFKKVSRIKVVHSWQKDKGFRVSRSRNKAIAKSLFDYIILIDGDAILHNKFIEDHLNHAKDGFFVQGSRVFLNQFTSNKLLNSQDINLFCFSKGLSNRKNALHSNFLSNLFLFQNQNIDGIKTCNLAFYKLDCIKVNGFNNDFEGWGREDTDFVVRLFNSGIRRKSIHFNTIQFHLWHKKSSRENLKKNDLILNNTIKNKLKWCESGINLFL